MTMSEHEIEDLLREQLGRVDSLTPPSDTDEFAARALAGGRALQARSGTGSTEGRRRAWTRGLLGVAAAVVVVALAVPVFRSFSGSTAGGTASSAAAPEQGVDRSGQSGGSAPAPSGVLTPPVQAPQGQGDIPETQPVLPPSLATPLVPDNPGGSPTTYTLGAVPYDWTTEQARGTIQKLRATYGTSVLTSLVVDDTVTPARLVVRMPRLDESVVAAVVAAFPAGAPITVIVG